MIPAIDIRYYAMRLLLWALTPFAAFGAVATRVGIALDRMREVGNSDPATTPVHGDEHDVS